MNRRGFLGAVIAAGLALGMRGPAKDSPAAVEDLVREALRRRRRLQFRYHGYLRQVEPHALGRMKDGASVLLAWQVGGGSRSEPPPGWRNFQIAGIEAPGLREETFVRRPDYDPAKSDFREILAEVKDAPR